VLDCASPFIVPTLECRCIADKTKSVLRGECRQTSQRDPCFSPESPPFFFMCTPSLYMDYYWDNIPLHREIPLHENYTWDMAVSELGGADKPEDCQGPLMNCKGQRDCTPHSTGILYASSASFSPDGTIFTTTTRRLTNFYNPGCTRDCAMTVDIFPTAPCSVTCGVGVQPFAHIIVEKETPDGNCWNPSIYKRCEMGTCPPPSNNTDSPSFQRSTTDNSNSTTVTSTRDGVLSAADVAVISAVGCVFFVIVVVMIEHYSKKEDSEHDEYDEDEEAEERRERKKKLKTIRVKKSVGK